MSANIFWRRVPDRPDSLSVTTPGDFIGKMNRAFNSDLSSRPLKLTVGDLPKLRGMLAMCEGESSGAPYYEMIEQIEEHTVIEIWAVY